MSRPRLAPLQTALAGALVLERAHALAGAPLHLLPHAALAAALGLVLGLPGPGPGRLARTVTHALPFALLTGGVALGWRLVSEQMLGDLAPFAPWVLLAAVLLVDGAAVRRVARLTRIELVKLASARLVRVGLLAATALAALAGHTHERLPNETSWSVAAAALGAGFAVAQVFLLVLGAVAVAGEASQGTLKMLLPHAYRRSDWVLAKGAALALAALVFSVLVLGAALAVAASGAPLGDVTLTAEGFGGEPLVTVHAPAADMRAHLVDTAVAETLGLVATGTLGLLVSSLVLGVVGALCLAFLAFAALKLGDLVLGLGQDTLRLLFPWPPERLRELTAKIGRGLSEGWDVALPAHAVQLALVSIALATLAACRALSRRDLHL